MSARPEVDEDLVERALELLINGRAGDGPLEVTDDVTLARLRRDADVESTLNAYFRSIRETDVVAALNTLAWRDATRDDLQTATKVLAAYFRWSSIEGVTETCDGALIERLAARFAVAISLRLAGEVDGSDNPYRPLLPRWTSPDVALGLRAPNHRLRDSAKDQREVGIIAMWLKLEGEGVNASVREQRIGDAFGIGRSTIYNAIAAQADYVELLSRSDWKELIEGFIREGLEASRNCPNK